MLAAMLVAQYRNADSEVIYGAWLVGSMWNFTLLLDTDYYVSRKFDASDRLDLMQIIHVLRALQVLILNR